MNKLPDILDGLEAWAEKIGMKQATEIADKISDNDLRNSIMRQLAALASTIIDFPRRARSQYYVAHAWILRNDIDLALKLANDIKDKAWRCEVQCEAACAMATTHPDEALKLANDIELTFYREKAQDYIKKLPAKTDAHSQPTPTPSLSELAHSILNTPPTLTDLAHHIFDLCAQTQRLENIVNDLSRDVKKLDTDLVDLQTAFYRRNKVNPNPSNG